MKKKYNFFVSYVVQDTVECPVFCADQIKEDFLDVWIDEHEECHIIKIVKDIIIKTSDERISDECFIHIISMSQINFD